MLVVVGLAGLFLAFAAKKVWAQLAEEDQRSDHHGQKSHAFGVLLGDTEQKQDVRDEHIGSERYGDEQDRFHVIKTHILVTSTIVVDRNLLSVPLEKDECNMIRYAEEKDLPAILEIYNDAILTTTALWIDEPFTLENRLAWFAEKSVAGYPILVDEADGSVTGFATYGSFRPYPGYKYTIEHSVYVGRSHRGRGIGNRLLTELIRHAEAAGFKMMIGAIDAANEGSIALHRKLGFTHAGTVKHAGTKFGRWLDLALYQLELAGPQELLP